MNYFAQPVDGPPMPVEHAYLYASGIVVSAVICLAYHPMMLFTMRRAVRLRVALSGLIYEKSLRLMKSSMEDGDNGKIINLLTNDLAKFEFVFALMHEMWKGPFQSIVYSIIIYLEVGWAGVIGVGFMLSFIPLQGVKYFDFKLKIFVCCDLLFLHIFFLAWVGKRAGEFQMRIIKRTDIRIKIMSEILSGIQVIKMYAWEKSFAQMVDQIRK